MPWILAGGGVVVIAVVIVLIFAFTGGSGSSNPEDVARAAVDAANDKDYDAIADLACDANAKDVKDSVDPQAAGLPEGLEVKFELGKVETISDTEATAEVKVSLSGDLPEGVPEGTGDTSGKMNLSNKDGDWCITGMG
jgi:hypothetical protein